MARDWRYGFCSAPSLQLDWNRPDFHKAATFSELFSDLAFVAANIKLSDALKSDLTWPGLLRFAAMYIPFFELWSALTFYTTRFFEEGKLMHQIVYVCMLGSIVFMAVPIGDLTLTDSSAARRLAEAPLAAEPGGLDPAQTLVTWFSVAAGFGAAVMALANLAVGCLIPRARVIGFSNAAAQGGSALLFGSAAATDIFVAPWLWVSGALLMKISPTLASFLPRRFSLPIHIEHVAERFALFLMLVLGEGVISLVLPGIENASLHIPFVIASLLLLWMLREAYYSGQPFQARHHAMRRKRCAGRLFIHAHLPLTLGALATGVALKSELAHVAQRLSQAESWLLASGVCFFLVWTSVIRMSHRGISRELGLFKYELGAHRQRISLAAGEVQADGSPMAHTGGSAAPAAGTRVPGGEAQARGAGVDMPLAATAPRGETVVAAEASAKASAAAAVVPEDDEPRDRQAPSGSDAAALGHDPAIGLIAPDHVDTDRIGTDRVGTGHDSRVLEQDADSETDSDGGDEIPVHLSHVADATAARDSANNDDDDDDNDSGIDVTALETGGADAKPASGVSGPLAAVPPGAATVELHPSRAGWEDVYQVGWDKTGAAVASVVVGASAAANAAAAGAKESTDGPVPTSADTSTRSAAGTGTGLSAHVSVLAMHSSGALEQRGVCCGRPVSGEGSQRRRRMVWAARMLFAAAPLLVPVICSGSAIAEVLTVTFIVSAYVCTDVFDVLGWRGVPAAEHEHHGNDHASDADAANPDKDVADAGKDLPRVKSSVGWSQLRVGGDSSTQASASPGQSARARRAQGFRRSSGGGEQGEAGEPASSVASVDTDRSDDNLFRFGVDAFGTCPTNNSTAYRPSDVCSI